MDMWAVHTEEGTRPVWLRWAMVWLGGRRRAMAGVARVRGLGGDGNHSMVCAREARAGLAERDKGGTFAPPSTQR